MKTFSALMLYLLFTFSCLQACVTYNPSQGTYTVDSYGAIELSGRKDKKPCPIHPDDLPIYSTLSSDCRWEGKPKIVKKPNPTDFGEEYWE